MFHYHCLNPISQVGLDGFSGLYVQTDNMNDADAILVRSAAMHDMELPEKLEAIARAGAGVNNIPLQKCAEAGIVVFNTPGANANGVKEAVLAGLLLASRDIVGGVNWVQSERQNELIAKSAERKRSALPEMKLKGSVSVSSVLARSACWWQMPPRVSAWRFTGTIPIFPGMRRGICHAISGTSKK